jgi:putative FmdB family regulatory protein
MPIYEYHCNHCGRDFDKFVRFSEQSTAQDCPHCGQSDTRKKLSVFSASGWDAHVSTNPSGSTGGNCGGSGGFS